MTRATDRGREFEHRVAKDIGGIIWSGQDGDVEIPHTGLRVECKFSLGFNRTKFKEWHNQIAEYEARSTGTRYVLAYSGGKTYQNARIWYSLPSELFREFVQYLLFKNALAVLSTKADIALTELIESFDLESNKHGSQDPGEGTTIE